MNTVNCVQFGVSPYVCIAVNKVQCFPQFLKHIYDSHRVDSIVLFTNIHSLGMSLSPILLDCRVLPFFYHVTFLSLHIQMVLAQVPDSSRTNFFFPGNFGRGQWGRKKRAEKAEKENQSPIPGLLANLCNLMQCWWEPHGLRNRKRGKDEAETQGEDGGRDFLSLFTIPSLVLFLRTSGLC